MVRDRSWRGMTFTDGKANEQNFDSYQILRGSQAPAVEVILLETADACRRARAQPVLRVGSRTDIDIATRLADQAPRGIGQAVRVVEGEIWREQVFVRERLDQLGGNAVGMDFQSQAACVCPVLPVGIRKRAERHQLVARREVLFLQAGQVGGPLVVPRPELRGSRRVHRADARIEQRLDGGIGMRGAARVVGVVDDARDPGVDTPERCHQIADVHVMRAVIRREALMRRRHVVGDQTIGNDPPELGGP